MGRDGWIPLPPGVEIISPTGVASSAMTLPLKSAKFSPEVHKQLRSLAADLGGTVDDALRHLLGMSTVRVPVSDTQRRRWTEAADGLGVRVDELIRLRMETCLESGRMHATVNQIFYRVDALCRFFEPPGTPAARADTPDA